MERAIAPDCLGDLNLNQVIASVTAGKEEYGLTPFFHLPLQEVDDVAFRHEVMRDLERRPLLDSVKAFTASMRTVRAQLSESEKLRYRRQKERLFLDAVADYCEGAARLADELPRIGPASRGLKAFRDYLSGYVISKDFIALLRRTRELETELAAIRYCVHINGPRVDVRHPDSEADYGAEIKEAFRRFQQGTARTFQFSFSDPLEMNHIETRILDQVAKLHPALFAALERFPAEHGGFLDPAVVAFDREIQFYVSYLEHITPLQAAGLSFCYPRVSRSKEVSSRRGFDLALAASLACEGRAPVCNDFALGGPERVIVVSGPNQGGKTTFARTFGQLHYLASLGLPVPGREARLFLFDRIFTHFERGESSAELRGKLQDDLVRIREILGRATSGSILVMNEIFNSTTFRDATVLSRRLAARILRLDLLCVWVTFIDELASLGPQTVSMVSSVVPENPAERTFRIIRRPPDGLAHALAIAERHRLTRDMILERVGP